MSNENKASSTPPVCSLDLFRSGVAYVTRTGLVASDFDLPVLSEQVDDVLATLGTKGPIRGISFQPEKNPNQEMERRNLPLPGTDTFRSLLLTKLKGEDVHIREVSSKSYEATVLGVDVDVRLVGEVQHKFYYLVLRTGDKLSRVFFQDLDHVTPCNPTVLTDLDFYAKVSRTNPRSKNLTVQVSSGSGDAVPVSVGYMVPAPVWKVKYDLTLPVGEDPTKDPDRGVLTPWAIVHNPLDEDLRGIRLRLTTGKPSSFRVPLHNPQGTERATLQDDLTVSPPTEYKASASARRSSVRSANMESLSSMAYASAATMSVGASRMEDSEAYESDDPVDSAPQAEVGDSGLDTEFVLHSVDFPPSGAVTLPLTSCSFPIALRRAWRQGSGANPDLVVALKNDSSITFERGAVSLRMGDKFVGQAVFPYTPSGSQVYLPYAKDQAIRVSLANTKDSQKVQRVYVGSGSQGAKTLLQDTTHTLTYVVEVRNLHSEPVEILVEFDRLTGYTLDPQGSQTAKDPSETHWKVLDTYPSGLSTREVQVSCKSTSIVHYQTIRGETVTQWSAQGVVEEGLRDRLKVLAEAQGNLVAAKIRQRDLTQELESLRSQEEKLIQKLSSLGSLAPQASKRYTDELEELASPISDLKYRISEIKSELTRCAELVSMAEKNITVHS